MLSRASPVSSVMVVLPGQGTAVVAVAATNIAVVPHSRAGSQLSFSFLAGKGSRRVLRLGRDADSLEKEKGKREKKTKCC